MKFKINRVIVVSYGILITELQEISPANHSCMMQTDLELDILASVDSFASDVSRCRRNMLCHHLTTHP